MTEPDALALSDWLDSHSNGPMDNKHKAAAELRRLHAEIEALRKEAERYRWLKRQDSDGGASVWFWNHEEAARFASIRAGGTTNVIGNFSNLDAAIDAAMKEASNG